MNKNRRQAVKTLLSSSVGRAFCVGLSGMAVSGGALTQSGYGDYKAVVALFLSGGYDGNDILLGRDASLKEYARSRPSIAIAPDAIKPIYRGVGSDRLGTHPSFAYLNEVYEAGRLAWLANVGALVRPTTKSQIFDGTAELPPFMGSHPDQVNIVQGWDARGDATGWAGRGVELLAPQLQSNLQQICLAPNSMLLTGRSTQVAITPSGASKNWGSASLTDSSNEVSKLLPEIGRATSDHAFERLYESSYNFLLNTSATMARLRERAGETLPSSFPSSRIGADLGSIASLLPQFIGEGFRRQIFYVEYGRFDTHTFQRGDNDGLGLDVQLNHVSQALRAWDLYLIAKGLDQKVITLVFTEFGRTFAQNGSGTDHGWGNHWFVLGTPINGGRVIGALPSPILGGPDDWDIDRRGRWIPTTSVDQVAATILAWFGVEQTRLQLALPNLGNFPVATLGFL